MSPLIFLKVPSCSLFSCPRIMTGEEQQETVFLLSGDDLQVHMYRQVLVSDEVSCSGGSGVEAP